MQNDTSRPALFQDERRLRLFRLLALASALDVALIFARPFLIQAKNLAPEEFAWPEIQGIFGLAFGFLAWNLLLAWLPYLAALRFEGARAQGLSRVRLAAWFAVWLAFLPNAPYIITDFYHLQHRPPVPVWYDMFMLFAFASTGLMLGLLSLHEMERSLRQQLSARVTQAIIVLSIGLSGFGVWLGRFQRWNSWDLLTNPKSLVRDVLLTLTERNEIIRALGVSGLVACLVLIAFSILNTLLSAGPQPKV